MLCCWVSFSQPKRTCRLHLQGWMGPCLTSCVPIMEHHVPHDELGKIFLSYIQVNTVVLQYCRYSFNLTSTPRWVASFKLKLFYPDAHNCCTHCPAGSVSPRASLHTVKKRKTSAPAKNQKLSSHCPVTILTWILKITLKILFCINLENSPSHLYLSIKTKSPLDSRTIPVRTCAGGSPSWWHETVSPATHTLILLLKSSLQSTTPVIKRNL
jgi:hypothetical protein